MAGIAAVLSRRDRLGADVVQRMLTAASHRGHEFQVSALGASVLGVSDDSDRREASLATENELAAAFVGRLDNLAAVGERLSQLGHRPLTNTPASTLIAAFRAFGDDAPNALRGVFAAAITDGTHLWGCRDHMGYETLFFRDDATGFYLASEPKQVVVGAGIPREPDLDVIAHIFYMELFDESLCALKGVRRVFRFSTVSADQHGVRVHRYWHPEALLETARLSPNDLRDRFIEVMTRAAARALTGDDVVALSGGIDSPAVAAFAAPEHLKAGGRPLSALSEVYPDFPSSDETQYIQIVARHFDMPLHTYQPKPQRLVRLAEWTRLFDTPWPTWSPDGAFERYTQARALGFRTILTGFVAEDVMGNTHYVIPHLLWRGRLAVLARFLALMRAEGASWRGILRRVLAGFVPEALQAARMRQRPRWIIPDWLDPYRLKERFAQEAVPIRNRWRIAQVGGFTGVGFSGEADAICQALCGVRMRAPWSDVDVWEFFLSLPAEAKFPNVKSKGLLRQWLKGIVPDAILDRRDKTTMNEWFLKLSTDYPSLRGWLVGSPHRIPGVNYALLAERLRTEDMDLPAYLWAKDLATIHAFLAQFGGH